MRVILDGSLYLPDKETYEKFLKKFQKFQDKNGYEYAGVTIFEGKDDIENYDEPVMCTE